MSYKNGDKNAMSVLEEYKNKIRKSILIFLEPVGVKAPKFSTDDRVNSFLRSMRESITLRCPAQGYPVPSFR